MKLTDYLNRLSVGEADKETQYEEEYVINALIPIFYLSKRTNGISDGLTNQKRHPSKQLKYANEKQNIMKENHQAEENRTPVKKLCKLTKPVKNSFTNLKPIQYSRKRY